MRKPKCRFIQEVTSESAISDRIGKGKRMDILLRNFIPLFCLISSLYLRENLLNRIRLKEKMPKWKKHGRDELDLAFI